MPESQSLPDLMPDDPQRRQEVEFALDQMRQQEVSERGDAEQEIDLGTPPQEVLHELGGVQSAAEIVGKDKAMELHQLAVAGPSREVAADDPEQDQEVKLMNQVMEKDAAAAVTQVHDRLAEGIPAQKILDDLGGATEARRIIGEDETQKLEKLSQPQKGEQ